MRSLNISTLLCEYMQFMIHLHKYMAYNEISNVITDRSSVVMTALEQRIMSVAWISDYVMSAIGVAVTIRCRYKRTTVRCILRL